MSRRSSLAGLAARLAQRNPALGIATGNGSDFANTTAWVTVALSTLVAGDGFALSNNALVCAVPGVYDLELLISAQLSAGAAGGDIAYRVNGGTEVGLGRITSTGIAPYYFSRGVKLASGDQVDIRIRAALAANTIQTFGNVGNATSLTLIQVSTFQ